MVMHSARKTLLATVLVPALSLSTLSPVLSASNDSGNSGQSTFGVLDNIFPFGKKHQQDVAPVQVAQTDTGDVDALRQQVRELTGKVEELNFMVLQMQEQIRQLQEGNPTANTPPPPPATQNAGANNGREGFPAAPTSNMAFPSVNNGTNNSQTSANSDRKSQGSGSIKFDQNGNIINGGLSQGSTPQGGNDLREVPQTQTAKELYDLGYKSLLAGDYRASEAIFRAFQERYPSDPQISDASFWLGESLYGQGRYREAAQTYIDVQRNYKESPHGPENLLKLGMSMAHLDEKKVACATFSEVSKRYKNADAAVLKRVKDEQSRNKCQ